MSERNIYLEDIPLDEALATLFALAENIHLSAETIPLTDALGRVTAQAVWAKLSAPHYHAAAMDGYAVRARDTESATETRPLRLTIGEQAIPINTGDPLPLGMDAVIMIEHVEPSADETILIRASIAPRQHVRLMGEDMVATELVLPANHVLRPVDLGAVAGCGHHEIALKAQPHVVIIPTGSELIPITETPQAGQIIEYNSLVLRAQVLENGGRVTILDAVQDDTAQLEQALQNTLALNPHLILVLSGSSAGSRDFTAQTLKRIGQLAVHGVAVRPGHPVIIGVYGNIPVIGVPGYPVSAALTGELFIQPLLANWLGKNASHTQMPRVQATSTRKMTSPMGDDDFVRVTLAEVEGGLLATPLNRGAGVITSLVKADGLVQIPRFQEGIELGQPIEVRLYRPLDMIRNTLLAMGSHDPMLDLLGDFFAQRYPQHRLVSANVGSMGGLVALRRHEAHLAGVHLLDPATGDYNLPYIAQQLPHMPVKIVTFAHREQGLMVAKGNPLGIQAFEDIVRGRYVNRQRGAGTRLLLDYELEKRSIPASAITGYDHEEYTHLAVAVAIASGLADCGLGVRQAAQALNLDFISVGWERYDLVIPESCLPQVEPLLTVLRDSEFIQLLGQQPGYDVSATGQEIPFR